MEDLYSLFAGCFPYAVREEAHAKKLLAAEENTVFTQTNEDGALIAAAVVHKNNLLLLCVVEEYRRRGIGSRLLRQAEEAIKAAGYNEMTVGAGEDYLLPGVPCAAPPVEETLQPDDVYPELDDSAVHFFKKRGFVNSWDCCCFDMRMELKNFIAAPAMPGVNFRWAQLEDIPAVLACTDDAFDKFTPYYKNRALYTAGHSQRALVAEENDSIVGTLLVSFAAEAPGLGSVGCTTVRHSARGRGIATRLVTAGTQKLREAGLPRAFLGYTYTGLDKLYGAAGYTICCYYFMAKKTL